MMPVIKSSQITSQAQQLRALGIVHKRPQIEAKPETASRRQPEHQGQQPGNEKRDDAVAETMENSWQGQQRGQQIRENFSVEPLIEDMRDGSPATHDQVAVSGVEGDPQESIAANLARLDAAAGYKESRQQGWDAGYEAGTQEGLRQGREEVLALQSCNERLAAMTDAISSVSQAWHAELESAAIEIGYTALLRIVGQKAGDRATVESMVRAVLEQLPERRLLNIHLAPADHALFHNGEGALPSLGAVLVADERVTMGGCIVETDAGSLDGRLETRLAELKAVLVELHNARELAQ